MNEPCKFEKEIFMLTEELPKMEDRLNEKIKDNREIVVDQYKDTKKCIEDLSDLIKGKDVDTPGLITKVLFNQKAVSKLWWLYSIIIMAILGMLTKLVFFQ
jgi:hypothetical protein